jgi:hypothetical protein
MKKLSENQVVKGTQKAIFNYEKSEASQISCKKSCKVSKREREVTQKHEQKFVSIRFYLF